MKYDDLVQNVNRIMADYTMPLTLRQIYYRLVAGGLVSNTRSNYTQLSSQLVTARERGDVSDTRIVDRSRSVSDVSFGSPERFIQTCIFNMSQRYVRRFWDTQPYYVEVWVEKDALSQVIADAVFDFNAIVAPSRGYSSYTYLMQAAQRIAQYGDEKTAIILHLADLDPSGVDMSRDLEARLKKYCRSDIQVIRVALTYEQVTQFNLIPNPVKFADKRSSGYVTQFGDKCWELDAIEPSQLVQICRGAVGQYVTDRAAWEDVKAKDKEDRAALTSQLRQLLPLGGLSVS